LERLPNIGPNFGDTCRHLLHNFFITDNCNASPSTTPSTVTHDGSGLKWILLLMPLAIFEKLEKFPPT